MLHRVSPSSSVFTFLSTLTCLACVAPAASYSGAVPPDSTPLVIDVENRNSWDAEVELDAEGTRLHLGTAPSYGRVRFYVGASRLGTASRFRVVANPMGTGREAFATATGRGVLSTPVIELLDHRSVYWTLGPSETTTNLIVR